MKIDLSSVNLKLRRAEEHAESVKNELTAWFESHPYSIVQKRNADFTRLSLIFRLDKEPSLEKWTLMVGDSLQGFRSALDHMIYAIGKSRGLALDGMGFTFPISDSRSKFKDSTRALRKVGLSDVVLTAIERFQPYNRPHPTLPPVLSILRDVNNSDKHKLLSFAFPTFVIGELNFLGRFTGRTHCTFIQNKGEIKHNTEIAAVIFDRPTLDVYCNGGNPILTVAIPHAPKDSSNRFSGRTECTALLKIVSDDVRAVISGVVAAGS